MRLVKPFKYLVFDCNKTKNGKYKLNTRNRIESTYWFYTFYILLPSCSLVNNLKKKSWSHTNIYSELSYSLFIQNLPYSIASIVYTITFEFFIISDWSFKEKIRKTKNKNFQGYREVKLKI